MLNFYSNLSIKSDKSYEIDTEKSEMTQFNLIVVFSKKKN